MLNIYDFLTKKCKDKNIRIESLPKKFDISRSALYRYMKGIVIIPENIQLLFQEVLSLDEDEKKEFERYVNLINVNSSLIESQDVLQEFLFENKDKPSEFIDNQFIFYEDDKFLRTTTEIFQKIINSTKNEQFTCEINMTDCMDSIVFPHISTLITTLNEMDCNLSIEHLVVFAEENYFYNASTLVSIIPLLKHLNYKVHYKVIDTIEKTQSIFRDFMSIKLSFVKESKLVIKYYCITFLEEDLSQCFYHKDQFLYEFYINNYKNYKKQFINSLSEDKEYSAVLKKLTAIESQYEAYFLLPSIYYNRMPISVYKSIFNRSTTSEREIFYRAVSKWITINDTLFDENEFNANMFDILSLRIDASYSLKNIDVYSANGLLEFAKTGVFPGMFDDLPPLIKSERKDIFENIKNRGNNPDDPYEFLITPKDIANNEYFIVAYKNYGLLVNFNIEEHKIGIMQDILIENKMIATIFINFIENYIKTNFAVKKEYANTYIDELISLYCE